MFARQHFGVRSRTKMYCHNCLVVAKMSRQNAINKRIIGERPPFGSAISFYRSPAAQSDARRKYRMASTLKVKSEWGEKQITLIGNCHLVCAIGFIITLASFVLNRERPIDFRSSFDILQSSYVGLCAHNVHRYIVYDKRPSRPMSSLRLMYVIHYLSTIIWKLTYPYDALPIKHPCAHVEHVAQFATRYNERAANAVS